MNYILVNEDKNVVTIYSDKNNIPSHQIDNVILIADIPDATYERGKQAVMKYDADTQSIYYDYMDVPLTHEEEIEQLKEELDSTLLESAFDKARIAELEETQGILLMEVAMLKMGGNL